MELLKYKIFLSIAECGSYTKVCDKFGYTQSGISKMMNSMENEIGFPLIIRSNKGISLTEEGMRLLPYVRQLIRDDDIIEEEFSSIRGIQKGQVRIGCFPTISYTWVPEIMKIFHEKYPGIHVNVTEENNIKLLEDWLNQGLIDIKISSVQPNTKFDQYLVGEDLFVVLFQKGHFFEKYEKVPVREIVKEKVLAFGPHEGEDPDTYEWRKYLEEDLNPVFTTNSDFTGIRMVEHNGLVAVLPELIARFAVKKYNVDYRRLDVRASREIAIAVKDRKRLSPAVKKFIECAFETPHISTLS